MPAPSTAEGLVDRGLWSVPHWRRYWLGRLASYLGTSVTLLVLPLLVLGLSGSVFLSGLAAALEALPYLVFGLFAGAVADRVDRRRLMVASDLANACVLGTVPLAAALGVLTVPQLLVVAFVSASLFVWFDAADFGALPALVGRSRLVGAHSTLQATSSVATIAGPLVAGVLIGVVGPATAIGVDAASYLLSAAFIGLIPARSLTPPREAGSETDRAGPSIVTEIRTGLRFVLGQPIIRTLTFLGAGLSLTTGAILGLLVVYGASGLALGLEDQRIGFLFAAVAAGSLVAAVVFPWLARRLGQGAITVYGLTACLAVTIVIAVSPSLLIAVPVLAAWSCAQMLVILNGIALRQRLTPDELQGRVNVTARMIAWGVAPFGAMAAGALAEMTDVRVAYLVLAVPVGIAAFAAWRSPLRSELPPMRDALR